ncbi:MAG: hypothetical protein C5B52_13870 [Bacteroidetes bacterium]|nr:MAG: hypothetical protein C5B52_13870 [Bacteroidota bacterium]
MFDDILKAVKDHFAENPEIANAIPAEHHDAVHNEIATQISNGLSAQSASAGGMGGILEKLESEITSGNPIVNGIGGGLVGSLASKFGLGSAAAGALAASLPALLQKFAPKPAAPTQ